MTFLVTKFIYDRVIYYIDLYFPNIKHECFNCVHLEKKINVSGHPVLSPSPLEPSDTPCPGDPWFRSARRACILHFKRIPQWEESCHLVPTACGFSGLCREPGALC